MLLKSIIKLPVHFVLTSKFFCTKFEKIICFLLYFMNKLLIKPYQKIFCNRNSACNLRSVILVQLIFIRACKILAEKVKPKIKYQRWARSRIRSPATFFGSRFEFLGKSRIRIRYEWYGVYRMYVKARQRWAQSRIRSPKFGG